MTPLIFANKLLPKYGFLKLVNSLLTKSQLSSTNAVLTAISTFIWNGLILGLTSVSQSLFFRETILATRYTLSYLV